MMMGMEEKRVEEEEEFKHVCRLCSKRYPSGKSLGGHMRSHVIANSNASSSSPSLHKLKKKKKTKKALVFEGNNNGYGLRENPRKTWRMVDKSTTVVVTSNQQRVCKQCGKSFQSIKALSGHMSSHSERDSNFTRFKEEDDNSSWASEEEDEEDYTGRSAKYRAIAVIGCSSNSYGVENEQVELAMCLMMLSRDESGQRVGFNFTADSSDNNSAILEGGGSSSKKSVAKRKNINYANGSMEMNLKCVELDNSESGYFENGAKELESDDSVDGYATDYKIKKPKVEYGEEEGNHAQLKKYLKSRVKSSEFLYDTIGIKKVKVGDLRAPKEQPRRSSDKAGKYQCSDCHKFFKTHQALGGHILTHKRDIKNASRNGDYDNAGNKAWIGSKKIKGHCCPFCPKVFRSGQALGGHKRSHLIGYSAQDKESLINSLEEKRHENHHRLLDLNLPAPVEEDGNGGSDGEYCQFKPW